jgi:hypothetical protein
MDCEKYEPLLIDELYEELDEVTSAAVKRHVAGCARCAGVLNGLEATRRVAVLEMEPLPAGLEDRILAAAKEAQKVVPIQSRFGNILSMAGRWAMRPQTAMAAVFLLMIGTSAFLIRAKKDIGRPAAVSVTEQGAPEPQAAAAPTADTASLNSPAAASAHGPAQANGFALATPPPAATATAAPPLELALKEEAADKDAPAKSKAADPSSLDDEKKAALATRSYGGPSNASAPAGAPAPMDATQGALAAAGAGQANQAQAAKKSDSTSDGFSQGMASYRARNYADATKQFDSAAQSGDLNSALWAAKSVKDGNGGCAAALPRFANIAQRAGGTWIGNEASLEAARCDIALGKLDTARDALNKLAQVPSHAQQAQQALGELNQVAAGKGGGSQTGGSAAARHAAPAAVKTTAAPARKPAAAPATVDGF